MKIITEKIKVKSIRKLYLFVMFMILIVDIVGMLFVYV